MSASGRNVVCLMGPTAAGKSAIALGLAQRFDLELVSVDSGQIYRGMDIGTAKPTADERARVPHHLIDLIDPTQAWSAAQFRARALALIDEITARGRHPLLVGGTMLYFKALREGLDELPAADPGVRDQLEQDARRIGWPAMHARLREFDPETAARLDPSDSQRIQRALEIHLLTGSPMSSLLARAARNDVAHRFVNIALEPSDRARLHARIQDRFDAMLSAGLVDEVRALRGRGDLHAELPAMRCVGYRQAWAHLDGRIDAAQLREQGIAATRQLAKRQLTWLRALPQRIVVDCLAYNAQEQVAAIAGEAWSGSPPR